LGRRRIRTDRFAGPQATMDSSQKPRPALVDQELVSSVARFIRMRWPAGAGLLAATWLATAVLGLPLPAMPLYVIGAAILAYNTAFTIVLRRFRRTGPANVIWFHRLIKVQIGLDWLAMTAIIHFSGGVESPALFYFFFHIIIAAIFLSTRATFSYAATATLLVGATVWLEYAGWLPHVSPFVGAASGLHHRPLFVLGVMLFFVSAMFVSSYLATTINSRLRRREREVFGLSENLQRAYGRLQTLYDSAQAINSTLELEQVLDRIVRRTAEAMNVRACSIRLLDESGSRLHVAAVTGLSDAYVKKGDLVLAQNPLVREVLAGRVIAVADVRTDTRLQYRAQALTEGIYSMLSAPLRGKKGPLGLIRAYSTELDHFTEADATFLAAMASEGSVAIENAMAYRALGQLEEMKSKFVLMVTHELRSPVGVIRSLLRTMTAGYVGLMSPEQQDIIGRALHRADFLQALIDDLLDLAAGKKELGLKEEHGPVRLDEIIGQVVERFETAARENHIELEYRAPKDGPVIVNAGSEGLDRIFNNLVSNAVKYTPNGGHVGIDLRLEAGMARVEVSDTGIGIPDDSLDHLFEEFFRAPNAKAQVKEGTGLGLAITKDLVARYGGQISVQSKLGKGTTFVVTLPLALQPSA
jgi:signal transduction histidine kinase